MSVAPVVLASIIGTSDKLNDVVNFCGDSQIFQPKDVFSFYSDTKELEAIETENPYKKPLEILIKAAKEAEKAYDETEHSHNIPDKELFDFSYSFAKDLSRLILRKEEFNKELSDKIVFKEKVSHFVGLDMDFKEVTDCKFIKIRLGRLPKESTPKLNDYKDNPYVLFFTATSDAEYDWGVYISPIDHIKEVDMIFSGLYFERLRVYGIDTTPEEKEISLDNEIQALKAQIEEITNKTDDFWEKQREKSSTVFSELKRLYTYCNVKKYAAKHNNSFILMGWIPESEKSNFEDKLLNIGQVECSFEIPDDVKNHTPPTKLKNKRLFRPFEFFVDMYGLPAYNEVDPTILVSFTYILMFGIMFGDFGNGLVLSIAGYLMWKFKKMMLGKILIPCGISSMIFGVLFGSCFGFEDAFNGFYASAFHLGTKPVSVMEPATTNMIIYAAVGLGFVLVLIAMLINIYSSFKRKLLGRAIFGANGICGLVFYLSLVGGIVAQLVFNTPVMNIFYIIGLIILPIIGILFEPVLSGLIEGRPDAKPEKWGEFLLQSIFEVFEIVLSYATNTISFLRVGAYVLVHTGMLLVVFTLAEMSSGIGYVIILVIGNAFVIALEGLLVGIQVLRLEFYEMFSRFYDGDGEPFTPITVPASTELLK